MNVQFQKHKPYISFKSNEWQRFGIDEAGQEQRNYIREWHENFYMPYQSIYETQRRVDDYEIKDLIAGLIGKQLPVKNKDLGNLGLVNLEQIGENSYRGGFINGTDTYNPSDLKKAGIKNIIDIEGFENIKISCEESGIGYMHYAIHHDNPAFKSALEVMRNSEKMSRDIYNLKQDRVKEIAENEVKKWEKNKRDAIDEFIQFIQIMQRGDLYIGCEFGTYRTDNVLLFDYLFNPYVEHPPYSKSYNKMYLDKAQNLFDNLTNEDKAKMDWDSSYNETFKLKLQKLRESYKPV